MQLDNEANTLTADNPKEDLWLAHWVTTAFNVARATSPDKMLKLGLAVSGGGDSMAMLHLFARHASASCYKLEVATVDHGLRPEAVEETQFVAGVCRDLGVDHTTLNWTGWDGKGNVQGKGRDARYALLADWARGRGLDYVLVGHTSDDVAETFLMRLARGSGLDGLAAMDASFNRDGVDFRRPLIQLDRELLRRFLRRHGLEWREDPSNEDRRYQRVRARDVLQALEPLGIDTDKLVSAANDLALAKHTVKRMVWERAEQIVTVDCGDFLIARRSFETCMVEVGRRLLSALLHWQGGTDYPPRAETWVELDIALRDGKAHTLNGCLATADRQHFRIAREYNAVKDLSCETTSDWDARWSLNGPHASDLHLAALGEAGILHCPDWRETGLPRASLLASPAVWRGSELMAAPLAGLANGWCATLTRSREQFLSSLLSH